MNNRIRKLRVEYGISRTDLALMLNVTPDALAKYERGDRNLSIKKLTILADYFDVTIGYLVGRSHE